jgi:hypothetical protein
VIAQWISILLQAGVLVFQNYAPSAYPKWIHKALKNAIAVFSIIFTFWGIALYPAARPWMVAAGLVVLAALSPLVGLLEAKYGRKDNAIYTQDRLRGHLLTNVLGALAAYAFWWVARSYTGFEQFVTKDPRNAAFNVMLPFLCVVVFAFVRSQQLDRCPGLDSIPTDLERKVAIEGYSLAHWHQVLNVLHLLAVTFIGSTSFLYLVAFGMRAAKDGHPLVVSWQVVFAIVVTLGFLYACGGPWSSGNRAVYLTFLTGTPAALGGAALWLSWFRDDPPRNAIAVLIVGGGYVLYCVEAVLTSGGPDKKVHLHYFAATGVALVLAILLAAMYLG